MSDDDLQLTPHQLQADGKRAGWWYEEPHGLSAAETVTAQREGT